MMTILRPARPGLLSLTLLAAAAVATAVGGFEHARLFHRGYREVEVVGPLFLLNAIGSAVVIVLLAVDRAILFVIGSLSISLGSLVSILISHHSSFFGFAEGAYDASATTIVIAEIVAAALTLLGVLAWGIGDRREATA